MKRFLLGMFTFLLISSLTSVAIASYTYGPALEGSYKNVTISVTAATSTTIKAVLGSTSARSLAFLRNKHATYDLYWGEGASISTVNTWHTLKAGETAIIPTCNWAPGSWGATNSGVYIYVSPTPMTDDVADFRSYKLFR